MKEDVPAYRYLQTREGMTCGIVPQGGKQQEGWTVGINEKHK